MRFLQGEVPPLIEAEGLEGTTGAVENNLGVPFKQQAEGTPDGADVHRLPEAVEHQNMLIQVRFHTETNGAEVNTSQTKVSISPKKWPIEGIDHATGHCWAP